MKNQIVVILLLALFTQSCTDSHRKQQQVQNIQSKGFQDKLIEANKMYVKRETDEIDQYVNHHGWQMIKTGTGLRYMITSKGNGEQAKEGQRAKLNFKISLLDGTLCYSSDSTGAKEFTIGQDHVETGLHEGIQYLHVGDKATFILPSYLAYGLVGDGNKIPSKASVLYQVELLSVH